MYLVKNATSIELMLQEVNSCHIFNKKRQVKQSAFALVAL